MGMEDDMGTGIGHRQGQSPADPLGGTGDEDRLARKLHACDLPGESDAAWYSAMRRRAMSGGGSGSKPRHAPSDARYLR
jgi:hypothetical protein